jgi:predicted ferric reductase
MSDLNAEGRGPNDQLPSFSVGVPAWALVAMFLGCAILPLVTAAWVKDSSHQSAIELGAAFGILAASLLFLQFLSSGRFERLSGRVGIDRTMGFHRIAAYALVAFAIAHPLSYTTLHFPENPSMAVTQLQAMLASPRLRSGVVALTLLVALVAFATVRTKALVRYEFWRAVHGPVAVVIAGLTLHHAVGAGTYSADAKLASVWAMCALLAFGAAFVVYVVRPWRMWREDWRVESANIAADKIAEVIVRGPERTDLAKMHGGQFVWLTVAPHRPPLHDHPLSIASSASFLPRMRFLVRQAGDCTDDFHQLAIGTRVAIDGPHGSFVLPSTTSAIVMVAGGVGIAPLLGMLEEAANQGDQRPYRLLYAAHSEAALAGRSQLAKLANRLDLTVTYCIDEGCSSTGALHGPICREHLEVLISNLTIGDTSFLICGPPGMMDVTSDTFLHLGAPMSNIHYERFDYGVGRSRIDKRHRAIALGILSVLAASAFIFSIR